MGDVTDRLAVVDIPSTLDPYVFIVGGKGPLDMLTREELRTLLATERELEERFSEVDELPEGQIPFLVRRFELRDAMSELGWLEVDLMTPATATAPVELIVGKPAMFAWACGTESKRVYRYYHGIVSELTETGGDVHATFYRAVVVPRLWRLTMKTRSRIFQKKTVLEIIEKILEEAGLLKGEDLQLKLNGTYEPRTYCVQYRESDFNFISRLMEEEGITYFFDHGEEKEVMTLLDARSSHGPCAPYDMIVLQTPARLREDDEITDAARELADALDDLDDSDSEGVSEERLQAFQFNNSLQPGKVHLRDYNFENSGRKPAGQVTGVSANDLEVYDYPGRFTEDGRGKSLARIRMEELDTQTRVAHGSGDFRSLAAGKIFAMLDHPNLAHNRSYLCTAVTHSGTNENLTGGQGQPVGMGGATYENDFECIPDDQQYRPLRVTPKPVVFGAQTAKVVGPAGEEIYTDKFLRVKVQFHWDLEGQENEKASCWLRVVQTWADKGFGTVVLPRIGTEVLVEFLEGDPDMPIVNGVVYNDQNMPPFDQPGKKMQTGIKSNTTPGGGGSNEIRLDDTSGSEELFIHAQKDQNNVVENDETTKVGHDRTETVGNNETITIGVHRTEQVGKNETISIGVNRTEEVGKDETISIGANRTEKVGKDEKISIGANRTESVGKDRGSEVKKGDTLKVGKDQSLDIGGKKETKVGKDYAIDVKTDFSVLAGKTVTITADKNAIHIKATKDEVLIEAKKKIVLKCGKASITLKSGGDILINGKKIKSDATQAIENKAMKIINAAKTKHQVKSVMVEAKGSGMNVIKGSMVRIN